MSQQHCPDTSLCNSVGSLPVDILVPRELTLGPIIPYPVIAFLGQVLLPATSIPEQASTKRNVQGVKDPMETLGGKRLTTRMQPIWPTGGLVCVQIDDKPKMVFWNNAEPCLFEVLARCMKKKGNKFVVSGPDPKRIELISRTPELQKRLLKLVLLDLVKQIEQLDGNRKDSGYTFSVNIFPDQLTNNQVVEIIKKYHYILQQKNCKLKLEILETGKYDYMLMKATMDILFQSGILFSLDDITAKDLIQKQKGLESRLDLLSNLKISTVKIDRQFFLDALKNKEDEKSLLEVLNMIRDASITRVLNKQPQLELVFEGLDDIDSISHMLRLVEQIQDCVKCFVQSYLLPPKHLGEGYFGGSKNLYLVRPMPTTGPLERSHLQE